MNDDNKKLAAIITAAFVAAQYLRGFLAHKDRTAEKNVISQGVSILGDQSKMLLSILALAGIVAVPLYNGNVSGPIAQNAEKIVVLQQSQIKQAEQTENLIKTSRAETQQQIDSLEVTLQEQDKKNMQAQSEVMRKIDVLIERGERTDSTISSLRAFAENQGFQLRENKKR